MLCVWIESISMLAGCSILRKRVGRILNCDFNGPIPPFIPDRSSEWHSDALETWRSINDAHYVSPIYISLSIKHASVIWQANSILDIEISKK